MTSRVTVVKVGGNEVEDAFWVARLADAMRASLPVVVVHGGGLEVSVLQRRFGVEPEWRDGLRVSSAETVRVAAMVLSGVVNKRLVAAFLGVGIDAIGLSGEDGALIEAHPALGGALGRTGTVSRVRAGLLENLLRLGHVPVVSPISRGSDGAPLNVNADDVAAAVAAALRAARLLFVSNVAGVFLEGAAAAEAIGPEEVEAAVASGAVSGGMTPKLRAAARAAQAGVADVRIGAMDLLAAGSGTRVHAGAKVLA